MSRPLRIELAGGLYHVTSRGDGREDIYRNDDDRAAWLDLLGQVCDRFNWRMHAWCQMTNHYHVVVETPEANLARGMRQFNGVYTQLVSRAHERVGHVFQGRYKAILVERDSYLLELARYVVLNPVRAGMVRGPRQWRWSSYRAMVGAVDAPPWLITDWTLGQFGQGRALAIAKYVDFVRAGTGLPSIWDKLEGQIYLGSEAFVERMRQLGHAASKLTQVKEVPRAQRRAKAPALDAISARHRERDAAMAAAFATGQYTLAQIAEHFGVHYSTVSRAVRGAEQARRESH